MPMGVGGIFCLCVGRLLVGGPFVRDLTKAFSCGRRGTALAVDEELVRLAVVGQGSRGVEAPPPTGLI